MYFFYFDESGSRDPSIGTPASPKDHIYVLTAVGLYERKWARFDRTISNLKLELADHLKRQGAGNYDLAACEVKSNWLRNSKGRKEQSPFLHNLDESDRTRIKDVFYAQLRDNNMLVMSAVIDKRLLHAHTTAETLHKKAYEFLLERIENFMAEYHPNHLALMVMDDTSKQLNHAIAMKHAYFQRAGNQNSSFKHIVEYPFFTRSELSNGVQLADLVSYNIYRAFRDERFDYTYFRMLLPYIYRRKSGSVLDGLKVWPPESALAEQSKAMWFEHKKTTREEGGE